MLPPNCAEVAGNLQIVLAEALNNVAEHAFAGLEPSEASVAIALRGDHLRVVLRDTGHPCPNGCYNRHHHQIWQVRQTFCPKVALDGH